MAKKQSLVFLAAIPSLYRWVDSEVLGIPSKVTSEFLKSLREEHLLTSEGEYEEEYYLEAPTANERVCYINLHSGLRWMWMYNVLISKFGVHVPFTHFQFSILERTGAAPSQLHPNSWAMIRGFEVICECLDVPPSPNVFFYLFTLTRPSGGGITTGWLSFRAQPNWKIFTLYEKSFHHFKPFYFKVFGAPNTIPFWEHLEGELRINCF